MDIQNALPCAPRVDIGLWRTATIDIARTRPLPVRLFGGICRGCARWCSGRDTGRAGGEDGCDLLGGRPQLELSNIKYLRKICYLCKLQLLCTEYGFYAGETADRVVEGRSLGEQPEVLCGERAHDVGLRVRPADARAGGPGEHRGGRREGVREVSAQVSDAVAGQYLQHRRGRGIRRTGHQDPGDAVHLVLRAQVRRHGHLPDLPGRQAVPGPHPRRRRGGRRRHRQCPEDRQHPGEAPGRRLAGGVRDPRRGADAVRVLRPAEPGTGGQRGPAVRESPQPLPGGFPSPTSAASAAASTRSRLSSPIGIPPASSFRMPPTAS